jgi:lysophospholipase L1-like esterase
MVRAMSSPSKWNWVGIIGTGQSLSVGAPPALTTTQPYGNLKLLLGPRGNRAVPPWNPDLRELSVGPLVEPLRELSTAYPAPYPGNVYGETPHTAFANQVTALARAFDPSSDYVSVHTVVGESGQGISELAKRAGDCTGTTGRAYAATLFEVRAIARLARAAGKSYGIGAILVTHGETDSGNPSYEAELIRLARDYNEDLRAITGQADPIPLYISQQHAFPNASASLGQRPLANQTQWRLGVERPNEFVCTGPKYQYAGDPSGDGVHLSAHGYQLLGEKVGQVHYERAVRGRDWQPLQPLACARRERTVVVRFHVPVAPLTWDEHFDDPAIPEWKAGRGFELSSGKTRLVIESVHIEGDSVCVTAAHELPDRLTVAYALASQGTQLSTHSNAARWGKLKDSDPFIGSSSGEPNPNYAVSFELLVP